MKKPLAVLLLVILSILAFAFWDLVVSCSFWYGFGMAALRLPSKILFLIALTSPIIFVYRAFRDKYGFNVGKFFLAACLPPFLLSLIFDGVILTIGSIEGGWGGLAVLGVALGRYLITIGLVSSAMAWTAVYDKFERIKRFGVRKALSVICLILCGVILSSNLYQLLHLNSPLVSVAVSVSDRTAYFSGKLLHAVLPSVLIGVGMAALMRFYRKNYSLKPPIFMLCAFLPALLISGAAMAAAYNKDQKNYMYSDIFTASAENLIIAAMALTAAAILYAVFSLIQRKRSGLT